MPTLPFPKTASGLTLAALLVLAFQGAPAASAHPGNDCGFDLYRLEGECYTNPTGCDPDWDGDHVRVEPWALASDGATAYIPSNRCGFLFDEVHFPEDGSFVGVGVRCTGTPAGMTVNLRVNLEFATYGILTFACNAPSSVVHVPWLDAPRIRAGTHYQLEIWAEITTGPVLANVEVDYLDFLPALVG